VTVFILTAQESTQVSSEQDQKKARVAIEAAAETLRLEDEMKKQRRADERAAREREKQIQDLQRTKIVHQNDSSGSVAPLPAADAVVDAQLALAALESNISLSLQARAEEEQALKEQILARAQKAAAKDSKEQLQKIQRQSSFQDDDHLPDVQQPFSDIVVTFVGGIRVCFEHPSLRNSLQPVSPSVLWTAPAPATIGLLFHRLVASVSSASSPGPQTSSASAEHKESSLELILTLSATAIIEASAVADWEIRRQAGSNSLSASFLSYPLPAPPLQRNCMVAMFAPFVLPLKDTFKTAAGNSFADKKLFVSLCDLRGSSPVTLAEGSVSLESLEQCSSIVDSSISVLQVVLSRPKDSKVQPSVPEFAECTPCRSMRVDWMTAFDKQSNVRGAEDSAGGSESDNDELAARNTSRSIPLGGSSIQGSLLLRFGVRDIPPPKQPEATNSTLSPNAKNKHKVIYNVHTYELLTFVSSS
jgi:hypothetical protein